MILIKYSFKQKKTYTNCFLFPLYSQFLEKPQTLINMYIHPHLRCLMDKLRGLHTNTYTHNTNATFYAQTPTESCSKLWTINPPGLSHKPHSNTYQYTLSPTAVCAVSFWLIHEIEHKNYSIIQWRTSSHITAPVLWQCILPGWAGSWQSQISHGSGQMQQPGQTHEKSGGSGTGGGKWICI